MPYYYYSLSSTPCTLPLCPAPSKPIYSCSRRCLSGARPSSSSKQRSRTSLPCSSTCCAWCSRQGAWRSSIARTLAASGARPCSPEPSLASASPWATSSRLPDYASLRPPNLLLSPDSWSSSSLCCSSSQGCDPPAHTLHGGTLTWEHCRPSSASCCLPRLSMPVSISPPSTLATRLRLAVPSDSHFICSPWLTFCPGCASSSWPLCRLVLPLSSWPSACPSSSAPSFTGPRVSSSRS